jgi:hypothetical protein
MPCQFEQKKELDRPEELVNSVDQGLQAHFRNRLPVPRTTFPNSPAGSFLVTTGKQPHMICAHICHNRKLRKPHAWSRAGATATASDAAGKEMREIFAEPDH